MWVPREESDDDAGGTMRLLALDAKQYVPVFTSRHQLEGALGVVPMLNPAVSEFVTYLPGDVGLAINPGGDLSLLWNRMQSRHCSASHAP